MIRLNYTPEYTVENGVYTVPLKIEQDGKEITGHRNITAQVKQTTANILTPEVKLNKSAVINFDNPEDKVELYITIQDEPQPLVIGFELSSPEETAETTAETVEDTEHHEDVQETAEDTEHHEDVQETAEDTEHHEDVQETVEDTEHHEDVQETAEDTEHHEDVQETDTVQDELEAHTDTLEETEQKPTATEEKSDTDVSGYPILTSTQSVKFDFIFTYQANEILSGTIKDPSTKKVYNQAISVKDKIVFYRDTNTNLYYWITEDKVLFAYGYTELLLLVNEYLTSTK